MANRAELIGNLADYLTRSGYFLATAESCTGGLLAAACTDFAGSSAWFKGGIVAYANDVKENILGVPRAALEASGAVSAPVAWKMAVGAIRGLGADVGISVTGIAGPGGGTEEKPVGTVWTTTAIRERKHGDGPDPDLAALAESVPGCERVVVDEIPIVVYPAHHIFSGDRAAIRAKAVDAGLREMVALLERYTRRRK